MESVGGPKVEQNENYISPSDAILSPTTQKLSQMKGKRLGSNNIKPRSLFAKTVDKEAQSRQKEESAQDNSKDDLSKENERDAFTDIGK
ncbi:MAG: hypothetical protein Q9160_002394 [Pyrenula sp. 1 TL-2023]